jgi:hypothetical protein
MLVIVILNDRLEEIGACSFGLCRSMQRIVIPNAVKKIKEAAFAGCSGLTEVVLGDGLEEIRREAFNQCTLLERIIIPLAVKVIHDCAFKDSTSLTNVVFCDVIESFVSCEAMQGWWNHGVHEKSLSTYCFLRRCNVPERLGQIVVRSWQSNVYEMLRRIPTFSAKGLNAHFDSIDSKLSDYENMSEAPELLGLTMPNNDIVLRILSFL